MDQNNLEQLVRRTLVLTEENNRMLRAMRRNARIGAFMKVVFILAVIAAPFLLYRYYLEPYVENLRENYTELQSDAEQFRQLTSELPTWVERFLETRPTEDAATSSRAASSSAASPSLRER